jgi:hypothetical protein
MYIYTNFEGVKIFIGNSNILLNINIREMINVALFSIQLY